MNDSIEDVLIRREGRAGRITLNRPKALNALTLDMVRRIAPALADWARDPQIGVVILDGAGDRALCAGGDVISLYNARSAGSAVARAFWREEYALNAAIHRYPKPFVPIMHGIVMGGGIGLSAHVQGRTRIVTEKSRIAFPETTIGLIPDVGGTWLLGRAPGGIGAYLALLGAPMAAADAIHAGFADVFVASERIGTLVDELCIDRAAPIDVIGRFASTAGTGDIQGMAARIAAVFSSDSLEGMRDSLRRDDSEWARKALADLGARSPTALKTTLAAIRRAAGYDCLEAALEVEFLLCTNLYEDGEFIEGVRALLVDKDKAPKWHPPALEQVTSERVERQFAPLAGGDALTLPRPAKS